MSYKHYILSLLYINVLLLSITNSTTAYPIITHFHRQGAAAVTPSSNTTRGIQSVETTQTFTTDGGTTIQICTITGTPTTLSDGESVVVITQNCSSTFIPSANSSSTTPVKPTISHISGSSTTVTLSTPSNLPTSLPVANVSSFPASIAFFTPVASPSLTSSSSLTSSPISTASFSFNSSISTVNEDNSGAHLSSLPIFLGVFGGVASFALISIGCMVYRPFQHLNRMRLNLPACIRHMREKTSRNSNFSFHCVPEKHVDSHVTYTSKTHPSGYH
ncbi:hypothetical protein Clacol_002714 [Clathrus columnatus]|uniref:Uncharacterized protein n=1 Tax=Clathrus columnatus TaxID=1419009 RepID=A0AAV5A7E9_9AGAM|nr:hypothetical protein Clacol_002714 [Clathrus columnatus]